MNPRIPSDELPPDHTEVSFVPMAAVEEESGRLDPSQVRPLATVRRGYVPFKENDVIFAKITPCMENGKIALAAGLKNGIAYGSTEFYVFRPYEGVLPRFILHYLLQPSLREDAERQMTGAVGQKRVPAHFLLTVKFLLPPTSEQERIVTKLDAALSGLERANNAAHRAQERLLRYRAAVLNSAVTGELTRVWRDSDGDSAVMMIETGDALLQRLLAARRSQWEDTELRRLRAAGKEPKNVSWKTRYDEPVSPDRTSLPLLPHGWRWTRLEQLGFVTGGLTKSPKRLGFLLQLPYLRVANVYANELRLDDMATIGVEQHELTKLLLARGDLLIVEGNGSKDQIGRLAIWDGSIAPCVHQNHIIKVRLVEVDLGPWILTWLLSPAGRQYIEQVAISSAGLYTLSISKVGDLPIPLPPVAEQAAIATEVTRRLTASDKLAVTLERQLSRARAVRSSLMHDAFVGRLTTQDPSDESAEVLLERIRAIRKADAKKPRARHMSQSRGKSARRSLLDVLREHDKPMTPEQLFLSSGYQHEFESNEYRQETVDNFYDELRRLVGPEGQVQELRPDNSTVLLQAR